MHIHQANAMNRKLAGVDHGRCSGEPMKEQHLVIDFTPRRKDTPETVERCQQFRKFANKQAELEGMMAQPVSTPPTR